MYWKTMQRAILYTLTWGNHLNAQYFSENKQGVGSVERAPPLVHTYRVCALRGLDGWAGTGGRDCLWEDSSRRDERREGRDSSLHNCLFLLDFELYSCISCFLKLIF